MTDMENIKPPTPKQLMNEKAVKIYAFCLCLLILTVVVIRRLRVLRTKISRKSSSDKSPAPILTSCLCTLDKLDRRTPWKWFDQPPVGLVVLVTIFLIGNVVLCLNILALQRLNHFASRFGWMTTANMALCVFLGLRNTPLTPIASISHTQLNILHRIVGYTTVLLVLAHAALYTFHLGRQGRWAILIREDNLEGIGAGIGMLVMLMGIWRHRSYKIFYASHIAGCIAILILASLHRPDWAKKLPVVMTFIASMWAVDRMIQTTRICYNLVNNQATFWPLPDGGTRILLKKPLGKNALPGSHCFLWIPRICMYQTHPFTIVSNSPNGLELVIKAYGGFTQGIHNFATQHPGHTTWVSVDGPYGSLPDTSKYDKTIMISGGSGAAFTFGLLNRIMSHTGRVKAQSIDFVWAVKTKAHLSWFNHHLHNLAAVHTTLHVTREDDATSTATATEEASSITKNIKPSLAISTSSIVCDEENGEMQPLLGNGGYSLKDIVAEIKFEKLNIETVICEAMQNIEDQERVFVAVCGPKSMHDAVRDAVDGCRERTGLRIDIHCEDFGS